MAVAIPPLGVAALAVGGLVSIRWGRVLPVLAGCSAFAVAVVAVVAPRTPQAASDPTVPVRIVSANPLGGNLDREGAASAIADQGADVVVGVELDREMREAIGASLGRKPGVSRGEMAVWSRWPLRDVGRPAALADYRVLRVRVDLDGSPFLLYAIHARNPLYESTFEDQRRLATALVAQAAREALPVVLAGDFNMSDRARAYGLLDSSFRDAMRAGTWPASTYRLSVWNALLLRIDHLFVPMEWCAQDAVTFEVPGSDHDGIVATVGPCRDA